MDIKEFVTETLKQIMAGVSEAQKEMGKYGAPKIPEQVPDAEGKPMAVPLKEIEFDVAVTIENRAALSGWGTSSGLMQVVSIHKVEGKAEGLIGNSSVSRVKFSVSAALPSVN